MIRSVAVLGAGVMGAQIAAHFANAGIPVLLLDLDSERAQHGLARARATKPDPFFTADTWTLIRAGSFDADLARIADSDWVIEAVVERLDVKRALLEQVDEHRRPGTVVSSNTSGISIGALAEGRSEDFRRHWLGTHFFNPPRYLQLCEVIPGPDTTSDVLDTVRRFASHRLGKGVVVAKDAPGFIGNHIAMYGMLRVLDSVAAGEFTIEEVDAITGPALGRPKSATFRTLDLVGLDVVRLVVENLRDRLGTAGSPGAWVLPDFVNRMIERGLLGEKSGGGFYKRSTVGGVPAILVLDPATLEYREKRPARLASLDAASTVADGRDRIRGLFHASDAAGRFLSGTLAPTLVYTATITPDIAHSATDIDRAMRWGFGWELGPFALIDTIGAPSIIEATRDSRPDLLAAGVPALVDTSDRTWNGCAEPVPDPSLLILRAAKDRSRLVRENAGASLVDLGDGVLCVEFHSKMNVLGADAVEMLQTGVREAGRNFSALVVGNEALHFSAGANLTLVLLEATAGNWEEIDLMIRALQRATMGLRYSDVPVVVATSGLALGGGCEIVLHADRVQASAESYIGLVEVGVGLIPAGGGTKEMAARAGESLPAGSNLLPPVQKAFEAIGFARTSSSGQDARRLGYLRATDSVTMNRERVISDAKAKALQRVAEGYSAPVNRNTIPVGGNAVLAPLKLGVHLTWRAGRISDHDALIGRKLATILAGGSLPHPTTVSEQHLLDLERDAFLSLVGERRTQERIQHTLKTGKPLRN